MCVRWNILRSVNESVVSPACILVVLTFFANGSPRASGSTTSMTMSQRLRVRVHSNRSLASTDTIPTSVLLCETAIPFSQDHDTDTNMRLPSVHNTHPEVDFLESDAKSASWTIPEYTQMLYSLHGNIACNFQCDARSQPGQSSVVSSVPFFHRSCQIVESMRCQACQYVQDTDIGELFGLIRMIIFQLSSILPLSRIDDLPYMEWTFWTNGQSSCWQLDPCLSMSLHVIRSWCDIVVWLHPALEWINCGHRHECPKLILFLFRIPSIPDPAPECVLLDPLWPFSTLPSNFASCQLTLMSSTNAFLNWWKYKHCHPGTFPQPSSNRMSSNFRAHNKILRMGVKYSVLSRSTTGSCVLSQDFGHQERGRRVHRSIFTSVYADTASGFSPAHPGSLEMTSSTLAVVISVISLFSEYCIQTWIILCCSTTQYDLPCVRLQEDCTS